MAFNSLGFIIFLPAVFLLYWLIVKQSSKWQNVVILVSSYFFYAYWDWRFLFLIIINSLMNYEIALKLNGNDKAKHKIWLFTALFFNLGILFFFKYYNFFADSFVKAFSFTGFSLQPHTLNIILPIGISFYTFQSMGYVLDVYNGKIEATRDILSFFCFASFFPQILAGPIGRAEHLITQYGKKRNFNYDSAVDGLRQILWGYFKKVAIADVAAIQVGYIFSNSDRLTGGILLLGAIYFTFQIYCDFSGYSDIAIGCGRLFGINLRRNFSYPYFSRDIAEFWRRWHISLTTWFRDYLYIPLGGSRCSQIYQIRNVLIIFLISGLWHGANWTFVFWGFFHALLFLPLILKGRNRNHLDTLGKDRYLPSFYEVIQMLKTFFLVTIAWIFFRAENLSHAFGYIRSLCFTLNSRIAVSDLYSYMHKNDNSIIFLIMLMIMIEWLQRDKEHGLQFGRMPIFWRWAIYYSISLAFAFFGEFHQTEFIYTNF